MRKEFVLGAALAATLAAAAATVAVRVTEGPSVRVGQLAPLLAHGHARTVAAAVTADARSMLSADKLASTWAAVALETGRLTAVTATLVVREGDGVRDELELLRFAKGGIGTLSAHWVGTRISGLVLLVGQAGPAQAAGAGARLAVDLVSERLSAVRSSFDAQMASVLSADELAAQTARVIAGLRGPVHVAAQVVAVRPDFTTVETYLRYANGLRRVETTFARDGSLAGLYIRLL